MKNFVKVTFVIISVALYGCGGGSGSGGGGGGGTTNNKPVAYDKSVSTDLATPNLTLQLPTATDADNDTVTYYFDNHGSSSLNPDSYEAYLDPNSGAVYFKFKAGENGDSFSVPYKVTDGKEWGDTAIITVTIAGQSNEISTGAEPVVYDKNSYNKYFSIYSTNWDTSNLPNKYDLSSFLPPAGNQNPQGSCTSWAVAYALKTVQEKIEENWDISSYTTFSPAWIHNQLSGQMNKGVAIDQALKLILAKGAATLETMPYIKNDPAYKPSAQAISEASNYKAKSYFIVKNLNQVKASISKKYPVVFAFFVYPEFINNLWRGGNNSVYTDYSGSNKGAHAVTIVGYDDNKFGGAFKVINSWGTNFGDNGFFWLPYNALADSRLSIDKYGMFILQDLSNTGGHAGSIPTTSIINENLPNLQVKSWNFNFTGQAGSTAQWSWEVINSGSQPVGTGSGIIVSLVASEDKVFNSADHVLTTSDINQNNPIDAGTSVSANNQSFTIPEWLKSGKYHIAAIVDDVDYLEEVYENDNKNTSDSQIEITDPNLPDLQPDYFYFHSCDTVICLIDFKVSNIGTTVANGGWTVLLEYIRESDGSTYLIPVTALAPTETLNPGDSIVKNNIIIGRAILPNGAPLPAGVYKVKFIVDGHGHVAESNENNNFSISDPWSYNTDITTRTTLSKKGYGVVGNGKHLPISQSLNPNIVLRSAKGRKTATEVVDYGKSIHSSNDVIFPTLKNIELKQ